MMDEEWGPWIEHDGKGCPLPRGTFVQSEQRDGLIETHKALCLRFVDGAPTCWEWLGLPDDIIRFRIRKPKALRELIDMAANLPVREDA
jgi:hypothetical protein